MASVPPAKVMATGAEQKRVMGWLWLPVGGDTTHPAETPKDEGTASKRWAQNLRGPRLARITPVNVLMDKKASKVNHVCVMVKDSLKEVPKHLVLHEREGFLIIQELVRREGDSAFLKADWVDADFRGLLEKQREKQTAGKPLPSAQYVQKLLIKKAVTGAKYIDDRGRESSYRRDVPEKEEEAIPPGEEKDGYFCIKELAEYMPPWEAFCHSKCGFYQDFYKVRWAAPYADVDYAKVENGCTDEPGCTWEPDENLPQCLDSLRIKIKRVWSIAQSERESKAKRGLDQASASDVAKRPKQEKVDTPESKVVKTQYRRDRQPLDADLVRFNMGHDLIVVNPERLGNIRTGWPLNPRDYPPGFGVASPPGFCREGCDCMDDQRGQRDWEVTKNWIPQQRGTQASLVIENFSREASFVRARGAVSKMFYFETAQAKLSETPAQRAAADLSVTIQGSLREVCMTIPVSALTSPSDPLYLPSRAILSVGNGDYLPLRIDAKLENGGPLPPWLQLEPASGLLKVTSGARAQADMKLLIEFKFYEGNVKTFVCTITFGEAADRSRVLLPIKQQLKDPSIAPLDGFMRVFLEEQLAVAARSSLAELIRLLTRCQNFLRASAVANLTPPDASRPRTPPHR